MPHKWVSPAELDHPFRNYKLFQSQNEGIVNFNDQKISEELKEDIPNNDPAIKKSHFDNIFTIQSISSSESRVRMDVPKMISFLREKSNDKIYLLYYIYLMIISLSTSYKEYEILHIKMV